MLRIYKVLLQIKKRKTEAGVGVGYMPVIPALKRLRQDHKLHSQTLSQKRLFN
jgi:hypothetical protein